MSQFTKEEKSKLVKESNDHTPDKKATKLEMAIQNIQQAAKAAEKASQNYITFMQSPWKNRGFGDDAFEARKAINMQASLIKDTLWRFYLSITAATRLIEKLDYEDYAKDLERSNLKKLKTAVQQFSNQVIGELVKIKSRDPELDCFQIPKGEYPYIDIFSRNQKEEIKLIISTIQEYQSTFDTTCPDGNLDVQFHRNKQFGYTKTQYGSCDSATFWRKSSQVEQPVAKESPIALPIAQQVRS